MIAKALAAVFGPLPSPGDSQVRCWASGDPKSPVADLVRRKFSHRFRLEISLLNIEVTCETGAGKPDGHGCVPILCTEGYACTGNKGCIATAAYSDGHGCVPVSCDGVSCPTNQYCYLSTSSYGNSTVCLVKTCKADSDCDCGVCFEGNCAPHMSFCVYAQNCAQGAAGMCGGGGGITGGGVPTDSAMGGAGGSVDSGSGG